MPTTTPSSTVAFPRPWDIDRMATASATVGRTKLGSGAVGWVPLICGAAALVIPWLLYTGLFLYEFYVKGSFLQDAGWFVFLMSEGGLSLRDPLALGAHSFLGTH